MIQTLRTLFKLRIREETALTISSSLTVFTYLDRYVKCNQRHTYLIIKKYLKLSNNSTRNLTILKVFKKDKNDDKEELLPYHLFYSFQVYKQSFL